MLLTVFYFRLHYVFHLCIDFKASENPLTTLLFTVTEKLHDFVMMRNVFCFTRAMFLFFFCWLEGMLESFLIWSLVTVTLEGVEGQVNTRRLLPAAVQHWISNVFILQGGIAVFWEKIPDSTRQYGQKYVNP